MCHLVLLLPVIALPLFWLLPLTVAGLDRLTLQVSKAAASVRTLHIAPS
jgi:hypothetical protein